MTGARRDTDAGDYVRELTDRYRADGYEVLFGDDARTLVGSIAADLGDSQFEIVMRRGAETVFFQVKRTGQQNLAAQARLEELARRIAAIPNARFDVLWLPPMPPEPVPALMLRRLTDARRIVSISPELALVFAESVTQVSLWRLAHLPERAEHGSTIGIAETLYADGILSPRHWAVITRGARLRNAIVHGADVPPSDETIAVIAEQLIAIAEELSDTATFERATELVQWFFERYEKRATETAATSTEETATGPLTILRNAFPGEPTAILEEAVRIISDFGPTWMPVKSLGDGGRD
jgi:hypothetical protein